MTFCVPCGTVMPRLLTLDAAVNKRPSMSAGESHQNLERSWIAANREDLAVLAPEAEEFIRSLFLSLEAVNEMLRDQLDTGFSGVEVDPGDLQCVTFIISFSNVTSTFRVTMILHEHRMRPRTCQR